MTIKAPTFADRARAWKDRYWSRSVYAAFGLCFAALAIGSLVPKFGDWLEGIRFGGQALLIIVASVVFEAATREKRDDGNEAHLTLSRPLGLLPHFERAIDRRKFSITFVGYSSETLYNLLSEAFARIPDRRHALDLVHVRILIPDCSAPMTMPCLKSTGADYPPYRALSQRRAEEFCGKIGRHVDRLVQNGQVENGIFEVRTHRLTPLLKAYVINDDMVFWGMYPIEESVYLEDDGSGTAVLDLKGTRTSLVGFDQDLGKRDAEVVRSMSAWIESVWSNAAAPTQVKRHA